MKTRSLLPLLTAIFFFRQLPLSAQRPQPSCSSCNGYELVWNDEFNGNRLDRNKWNFHAPGKRRDAFNTPAAVSLDGHGFLKITASVRNDSVFAAILSTEGTFETRYGFFECRAALTGTKGIWPAFWLFSPGNSDGNPAEKGAEIDIFEYFLHDKKDSVCHTLHYGGYGAHHQVSGPVWSPLKKTPDGFHTFGLEWTPDAYAIYVDGQRTLVSKDNISKVPEVILLSVEVDKLAAGTLDKSRLPDSFTVDYVRVFKKK